MKSLNNLFIIIFFIIIIIFINILLLMHHCISFAKFQFETFHTFVITFGVLFLFLHFLILKNFSY